MSNHSKASDETVEQSALENGHRVPVPPAWGVSYVIPHSSNGSRKMESYRSQPPMKAKSGVWWQRCQRGWDGFKDLVGLSAPPSIWAELIGYCSWCRVARLPGAASTLIKDRTREQRAGARPSASNQIRQRWGSDSKPISVAAPNYSNNHESIEKRKCYGPWLAATSSNVAKINRSRNQETRSTSTTGPKERSQGKERSAREGTQR